MKRSFPGTRCKFGMISRFMSTHFLKQKKEKILFYRSSMNSEGTMWRGTETKNTTDMV